MALIDRRSPVRSCAWLGCPLRWRVSSGEEFLIYDD
jgi:hypothetical protein